jgi:hypothetical protein
LKAIIFAIVFLPLLFPLLKLYLGVFITHTTRVLKPNLEDLFQMRQISWRQGWLVQAKLEVKAKFAAAAGGGALIPKPK